MKTFSLTLAILLIAGYSSIAQTPRGLKIGETVPDVALKMYNYKSPTAQLSDFKGKAILLDFWATWCQPCVASFPKLNQLQEQFNKDLVILPVTYEPLAHVSTFAGQMKKNLSVTISSVVEDEALNKLFLHSTVPHYVWINKNGIVAAITYLEDVTADNLKKLISSQPLSLKVKRESLNGKNPWEATLRDTLTLYSSVLTGYVEGVPGETSFAAGGGVKGNVAQITNCSLLNLFQWAYGEASAIKLYDRFKYIKLITTDTVRFTDMRGDGKFNSAYTAEWLKRNGLNYLLKVPKNQAAKKWEIMRQDLKRYFPDVSARMIKEKKPVLVLKKLNANNTFASKADGPYTATQNMVSLSVKNGNMEVLPNMLRYYFQHSLFYGLLNETGYDGKIDVTLEANMANLESLNAALEKYGLKLEQANREVDILEVIDHSTSGKD